MPVTLSQLSVLGTLSLQNGALAFVLHRSRRPDASGGVYSTSTAVLLAEVGKVIIALVALKFFSSSTNTVKGYQALPQAPPSPRAEKYFEHQSDSVAEVEAPTKSASRTLARMAVPALLYVCQNHLQLIAVSYLGEAIRPLDVAVLSADSSADPATFQILAQLKIAATALFAMLLQGRNFSCAQLSALGCLMLGVFAVQASVGRGASTASAAEWAAVLRGVSAIFVATLLSGFAGVYLEVTLKDASSDFWTCNLQLAALSLIPALVPVITDAASQDTWAPLDHFGAWAWAAVTMSVGGGECKRDCPA
jgi:UDP-sugar transporter A1/2/3